MKLHQVGSVVATVLSVAALAIGVGVYVERTDTDTVPRVETCDPGQPRSADGTCGLSWDDIRESEIHYQEGTPNDVR